MWIFGLIHSAVHKTPRSASSAIARRSFALSPSGSCSANRRYLTARGLLIANSNDVKQRFKPASLDWFRAGRP
jgi:hypothetical protein